MVFDPKVYRNNKDALGAPADSRATDATSDWTMVSLLKGIWHLLSTGVVVTGGATAANQTSQITQETNAATSLAAIDDWDENDRAKVNPIAGQVGVEGGSGTVTARTQRTVLATDVGLPAGSSLLGRIAADATSTTGGIPSTHRLLSATGSSGDAANVKASAGRVYAIQGYNAATGVRYLKLYNSASAPTAGSGTPVKTLALPPSAAFAFDWAHGLTFATGIGFTLVTGSADNSSASVTAADIVGLNIDYA